MFSKALFKQSCKANGTMWGIITLAVCFMLSCVMLISGNGNIGEVKDSIQDTIITKEVDAQLQKRELAYYENSNAGLEKFDAFFAENAKDTLSYLAYLAQKPEQSSFADEAAYLAAVAAWQNAAPTLQTEVGARFPTTVGAYMATMPQPGDHATTDAYMAALQEWQAATPATQENALKLANITACEELQRYVEECAEQEGYAKDSDKALEMLGSVLYVLDPDGMFDSFYTDLGEDAPEDYDILTLVAHIAAGDVNTYLHSAERIAYRTDRASEGSAVFLAGNMTKSENVEELMQALSSYGVTKEKYESFGYTYSAVKHMAKTAALTYQGRTDYELEALEEAYANGQFTSEEAYLAAVAEKKQSLANEISASFLSTLPEEVSDALEEIGQADLYTLIVGSIFYKLAGLLLPIIYVIMASNNLIAGQVDSGSMAYVLSTSTQRSTVVFTQAVYLIGSLLAMFSLTTATGCICLAIVKDSVMLTYKNLILLNVGAFLVLLTLSGLCFFTSCVFDRSKRSMAIGGGLSIFALVAAMLGLFGSPVIPSVVRLEALNNFNYATVISLFDVVSIIDGTGTFVWKFVILAVAGLLGYVAGAVRFTKKDLPL